MISRIIHIIGHDLHLIADGDVLIRCKWTDGRIPENCFGSEKEKEILDLAVIQIKEYLAGSRTQFTIPLRMEGTEFRKRVWQELQNIPYGVTITYGELARRIGCPKAFRAVANACGANPLPIIIPCHRVIASGGKLGGYTGGLDIKTSLLSLEHPQK